MTHNTTRFTTKKTFLALGLTLAFLAASAVCSAGEITIDIAPETLNLASSGRVVTVHTDATYSSISVYSVYLSGVAIDSWKADDRGYFVAKFLMDDVKSIDGLSINDTNTFQFVAVTVAGDPVSGEAEVYVIDRETEGNNSSMTSASR